MPASAIEISFCGAATTASTLPSAAYCTAAAAKARDARPPAALVVPKGSDASSGWLQSSTFSAAPDQSASPTLRILRKSTRIRQARAWRSMTAQSLTTIGLQTSCTPASSAALILISGPMPAGSPAAMAIIGLSPGSMRCEPPLTPTASAKRGSRPARLGRPRIEWRDRRP